MQNLGRNYKNSFRVYACCFVNNTVTYFNLFVCLFKQRDMSVMTTVPNSILLILIFSTLCVVHDLIFQRRLSRRRQPITFVYFVSHASAQALRPITFTQRFRTTRHLFSIQLLRKPKILNVEDKQTKFERSKGDLRRVAESCKLSLTRAQLSKHMDLRCF